MSDFNQRIAALSPEKRELLLQLMQKQSNGTQTTIKPQSRASNTFPLSYAQQRLWFLDQFEANSSVYNLSFPVRLTGSLNVTVLKNSLKEIVRRHEALRTTFVTVEGQPLQVIAPSMTLALPVVNLRELSEVEQNANVLKLVNEEAQQPFDLSQDPLLRTTLLQLNEIEHVMLFTMHHIISDGWSLGVLVRELAALYAAFSAGKPSPLPELPIQYADFAVWQRQWLQGEVVDTQLDYWRQQLGNRPPILQLPTDRPRPAIQTFRGATKSFSLPTDLTEAIKALSQQENVTLFMTLLAAFKTLLHRYTSQDEILIGSVIANRNRIESEPLIGFFVNTLVLRTNFGGNPTFRELLERVREVMLGAYAHQDLPFEYLLEKLQPERDLSRNPLFEVTFALQNTPAEKLELPGLTLKSLALESRTAKFDLSLDMFETSSGLSGVFEYNTDLFDAATIARMVAHLCTLLSSIVTHPGQCISDLPLLTAAQRQQLLVEWNDTQADYARNQCIYQLFEAQVERSPDTVAIFCEGGQLTYRELNQRANKIAHYFRSLGVEPEVLVGICIERSLEMVTGLLGILKAGGAYVPLDPDYPKERLAFMLSDSQVPVLLTQQKLVARLPDIGVRVVCLDTDWEAIARESEENLVNRATAQNLAYAIYTSGSTGKPKGVAIQHQSLVNYTEAAIVQYKLELGDRILQFASISFDAAAEEIFPSLVQGATLILRTDEMLGSVPTFLEICCNLRLTVLDLPTTFWHQIVVALSAKEGNGEQGMGNSKRYSPEKTSLALPESLRLVIIGGERALAERLTTWQQQVNNRVRLMNSYGPTEATIVATTCELSGPAAIETSGRELPIGRSVSNIETYVLDSYLQPVPVGVPGELYIGGVGVARGYLNQPDLTAVAFIPHPFSKAPGARLYKTGDLVRYRTNGNIEYLDRIDEQVKIRGFRIELRGIEAELSQHPAVQEAVVVAREDAARHKRLVAYIVPTHESEDVREQASANEGSELLPALRNNLEAKLPKYMVPSAFVILSALPLTQNGKVDRQALPEPDATRPEMDEAFVAPRNRTEEVLAGIWANLLGLESVGVYDNFFELGGDSILSMQIIAKAKQAGLQLTPKQLFQYQTIAELAAVAITNRAIEAEQGLITGSLPLTPIQHWFFAENLPDPHHWNQAFMLETRQPLEPMLLERVVQQLLIHHDALRLRFVREKSSWQQINTSPDEEIPLVHLDLSILAETEQKQEIEAAAAQLQASLNPSERPLLRLASFNLGMQKPGRLLIIIHHLVVDGVSWRILLSDFQSAYRQLERGEAIQLPCKTTSFKQWAERLREYAHSPQLQAECDYWLTETRCSVPHLPVDYSGGNNTVASARTVSVELSVEETQALLQKAPATYQAQSNDLLLAALAQAFQQWMGTSALLVDLEGHGREDIFDDVDLSRTVGWFTTVFPVRLNTGEACDPKEALKAVKEQLRSIPNRGIGYGVLRYLGDREISSKLQALPQAEVIFNYLGQSDQVFSESSLFRPAQESSGTVQSLRGRRSYLLDINGIVTGGQLRLSWTYSDRVHRRTTIERLAESFVEALRFFITHSQLPAAADLKEAKRSSIKTTSRAGLLTTVNPKTIADLNAEAVLDPTIRPDTAFVEPATEPNCIFLTGATGFLGAFLLYELLQQTQANIYCLVRSPNADCGKKRLQSTLESYGIWRESLSSRIIPVVGDLSKPLFGLSDEQFRVIASKLDLIYHSGAAVNLIYPYLKVKAANVLGTQEVLRLASLIKVKPVHYISTLNVLESVKPSADEISRDLDNLKHVRLPDSGYVQSKWVAEKLITAACSRGIPTWIYRTGSISGHSQTGVCNTNDHVYRMIKGCIQLENAPDVDGMVALTPVDYVSRAILHLSKQKEALIKVFHILNPHPIRANELFNWLRSFGYRIQPISYETWQAKLLSITESSQENAAYPLLPMFAGSLSEDTSGFKSSERNSVKPKYDCQDTLNELADGVIACPPVDTKLLHTYFSYLVRIGFLDAPRLAE